MTTTPTQPRRPVQRWVTRLRVPPQPVEPRVVSGTRGLRRRRTKDLAACARLLRVVHDEGQYLERWPDTPRAWLCDDDVVDAFVVERLGEILGHAALSRVGADPVSALRWRETTGLEPERLLGVSRWFTRPRVRGEGLGAGLLDVAVREARTRGRTPVIELVSTSTDAIRLVEHLGWRLRATDPWQGGRLRLHRYVAPPG